MSTLLRFEDSQGDWTFRDRFSLTYRRPRQHRLPHKTSRGAFDVLYICGGTRHADTGPLTPTFHAIDIRVLRQV